MGCLLSRSNSRLDSKNADLNNTIRGDTNLMSTDLSINAPISNGYSVRTSIPLENGIPGQIATTTKPLSQLASQSQTEFFKMLEEKIAKGNGDFIMDDSESER